MFEFLKQFTDDLFQIFLKFRAFQQKIDPTRKLPFGFSSIKIGGKEDAHHLPMKLQQLKTYPQSEQNFILFI